MLSADSVDVAFVVDWLQVVAKRAFGSKGLRHPSQVGTMH